MAKLNGGGGPELYLLKALDGSSDHLINSVDQLLPWRVEIESAIELRRTA